jgi:TolB-like protein
VKHLSKILLFTLNFLFISAQNTVAVLDFEGIGVSKDEARALSNRFGTEFMSLSSGRFVLVERQQMGEILEEQGFQQSGCVSSECAVEVGAALGAKFIIIGSISKVGSLYSVNARFLDVETSEIIRSISHDQMGDIMTLMTRGMKESALKLLGQGTSSEPMVTTGSFTVIALETGITLHNAQTGEYIADAPTITPEVAEDMDPGVYSFLAKKNGYLDQIFKVEVFAGQKSTLTISGLKKATGVITVNVNVSSANVYLLDYSGEYKLLGQAPITTDPLPYNENYSIKVTKDGYDEEVKYVAINSPEEVVDFYITYTLPTVNINVNPKGSNLILNENYYKDFSSKKFALNPGTYPYTVAIDGYLPQRGNINLEYGDNKVINISLIREIAEIKFNVNVQVYDIVENKRSLIDKINNNTLSGVEFGYHNYLFTAKKHEPLTVGVNVDNIRMINQNVSLVRKSPQKAFRKSLLFPGRGQLYAENKGKGFLMMGLHLSAGFLAYSNYTKYNDSIALKDEYYLKYKSATDLNSIATNHAEYERNVKAANDAAGMVMTFGATFVINWAFSAVDALLFSGL